MRIGLKLTAAFLLIALLVAAAGYLAQLTGRELKQQMERLSQSAIRQMSDTTEVTIALYADQMDARRQVTIARSRGAVESPAAESGTAELTELVSSQMRPSLERLQQEFDEYQELMNRFRVLLDEDIDAAEQFLEDRVLDHVENELAPRLVAIREQAEDESTGGIRSAERALVVADQQRGILLVAAAAAAISIGLVMSRSIGRPLGVLQRAAEDIGRGRLETRVAIRSRDEIGMLAAAINQMAAELREKTVSKDYVDNIIHSMREMLIVADANLRIRLVNPAACSELGYTAVDLLDRPLRDLFSVEDLFSDGELSPTMAPGVEGFMQTESGDRIPVHFSAAQMRDEADRPTGIVCVALNVSRQKDTEDRLRGSLREKDLLLKEVHHRVKNNLQVISSLLSLQAQEIRDPEMIRMFQESQTRVRSMALIHEQLYRSNDLARINFAAYVEELVDNFKQGFGSAAACVSFSLEIEPIPLLLDLAVPCGMIVNELVANALEHAFSEDRPGEIRIAFGREDEGYRIVVADNGVGMHQGPAAGEATSIGLKVVQALTRQIHGRLDHACQEGTMFTIHFDNPEQQPPTAK